MHANIHAGERNTGQPWGALIRKLLGRSCRLVKGGKGAQSKWKATNVSTLSVSASEADFKELVFNVKEQVKRGTFSLTCDESETNITFFSSEDRTTPTVPPFSVGTSATPGNSPAFTEELAEMKRELQSTLSEVSSQQAWQSGFLAHDFTWSVGEFEWRDILQWDGGAQARFWRFLRAQVQVVVWRSWS